VNGPYGGGKSTVMRELLARRPAMWPFEPEHIGTLCAHRLIPERLRDWQDLPMWRRLTAVTADGLLSRYGRPLVMALTVLRQDYAEEIVDGLDGLSWPVFHLMLDVPTAVLRERVARTDGSGSDAATVAGTRRWRLDHMAAYEQARAGWLGREATFISNAGRDPGAVAEEILRLLDA